MHFIPVDLQQMKFQAKITTMTEAFKVNRESSNLDDDKIIRLKARMDGIDANGDQPDGAYTVIGWPQQPFPVKGLGLMQWPKK